jgi:hypothetical protein
MNAPIDEIEAAARAAENRPGFPAGYVERVREATARLACVDLDLDDTTSALAMLEQFVNVDAAVPTTSKRASTGMLKRIVLRLTAFALQYLAQQVTLLGQAVVRFGHALGRRIDALDADVQAYRAEIDELRARVDALETRRR